MFPKIFSNLFQNSHYLKYLLAGAPDMPHNDHTHTIMWMSNIFDPVKGKIKLKYNQNISQETNSNGTTFHWKIDEMFNWYISEIIEIQEKVAELLVLGKVNWKK